MDLILSGKNYDPEAKPFLDIHGNYVHSYELEKLKSEPICKDFIETVKPIDTSKTTSNDPFVSAKFFQFDATTTKRLTDNCKANGTTVQGALSTAIMLAHLNYKNTLSGKFINSCPCNMRPYVMASNAVSKDDIICGSAALIWEYDVSPSETMWQAVEKTSGAIKKALEEKYGLKWWIKLENSMPVQAYSCMSSSMGIVSLSSNDDESTPLENLKLNDLRFLGSNYRLPPGIAGTMIHAFTFMNRFTMSFNYTYPSLSNEWAEIFSRNVWTVLEIMASTKSGKGENDICFKDLIDKLEKHHN